jgi:hypothetical protein
LTALLKLIYFEGFMVIENFEITSKVLATGQKRVVKLGEWIFEEVLKRSGLWDIKADLRLKPSQPHQISIFFEGPIMLPSMFQTNL